MVEAILREADMSFALPRGASQTGRGGEQACDVRVGA